MCDIESGCKMAYNVGVKKAAEFPARPLSEDFMEKYFIVVPCYNEEEVLPETMKRLGEKLSSLVAVSYTHLHTPQAALRLIKHRVVDYSSI